MKADILDPGPDKRRGAVIKDLRAEASGPSLSRRAYHILWVKIYFLVHERDGRSKCVARRLVSSVPAEGKIVLSFILSLVMLSVLVSSWPAVGRVSSLYISPESASSVLAAFSFIMGAFGFMAMMVPVILVVSAACLTLLVLSRLAEYYVAWHASLQK